MERKTEKVQQFYTSLSQGDFEAVGALFAEDLVWHQPGQGAVSGIYRGKGDVFVHLRRMAQLSEGTFAINQVDYIAENNDLVVATIEFGASVNESSIKMKGVDLFRFEDGLIKEVWLFSERSKEEDLFWTNLIKK